MYIKCSKKLVLLCEQVFSNLITRLISFLLLEDPLLGFHHLKKSYGLRELQNHLRFRSRDCTACRVPDTFYFLECGRGWPRVTTRDGKRSEMYVDVTVDWAK